MIVCAALIWIAGYLIPEGLDFTRMALFAFIPVVLTVLYYGLWAGLLSSAVIFILNAASFGLRGGTDFSGFVSQGGLSIFIALIAASILVGHLSDLKKRLEHELSRRKRAEAAAQSSEAQWRKMEQAEREQRVLAEALQDITAALNSTLNFDEVLDRILTNVDRAVPHDSGTIMLVESGVAQVALCKGYAERGAEQAVLSSKFIVAETPNLRKMTQTGQPVFIEDTYSSEGWIHHPETSWLRSYVGAPVQVKGQTIGFINLDSETPGFFTQTHADRLQAISEQAGIAIENARLFDEVQRFARQMTLLNDITRIALSAPTVENMLQRIADRLGELFNADEAYITLWDEERQIVIPVAAYGPARKSYPQLEDIPGEPGMTEAALRENRVLVADDVSNSPYVSPSIASQFSTRSMMGLPLTADNRNLGAVLIGFGHQHLFTQEDKSLGEQAAVQISLAILNARLYDRIQQLAITDDLTELLNRRGFYEFGNREVERALRFEHPLSAIMIDIDLFKAVNDTHGHAVGDQVLKGLSHRLKANLRAVDIIGRYGGEEFIVLLPETNLSAARMVAGRLHQRVVSSPFSTSSGEVSITISLGVSALCAEGKSLDHLIENCDQALYISKDAGRNRVSVTQEQPI